MGKHDLEVTGILDPDLDEKKLTLTEEDIDLEMKGAFKGQSDGQPTKSARDDLLNLDGLEIEREMEGGLDDIDFDLKEIDSTPPVESATSSDQENDFDFELEDSAQAAPLDTVITSSPDPDQAPLEPATVTDQVDDFDFELEDSVEGTPLDAGIPAGPARPGPDEVEEEVDFDLVEMVEPAVTPEPPPAVETTLAALNLDMDLAPPVIPPVPEAPVMPTATLSPPAASTSTPVMPAWDPAVWEPIIERAVRNSVAQVLERVLPQLIDEVLTREIERLRQDMAEG